MARAKKHVEEFNPWPPFVDVFSSVILVLLLFILVTIVNIAYYMQFNSKVESVVEIKKKANNEAKNLDPTSLINIKRNIIQVEAKTSKQSMFDGGESEGNAMALKKDETTYNQNIQTKSGEIIVGYSGKEIFVNASSKSKVESFANVHKGKKIVIEVAKPMNIISSTLKKQISIGRMITIKNIIKKSGIPLTDIKIKVTDIVNEQYPNGYVKVISQ